MIELPRVGLGTAPLGGLYEEVAEETALAAIDRAWERGVRWFDTAPLYGHGASERRLGHALQGRPRDDFVLATKVGRLLRAGAPPDPGQTHWRVDGTVNPVFDFSYDGVLRSVDESLERLNLERIDVLHIHDPVEHVEEALAGAYPALDRLRAEGVIRAVGVGMAETRLLARFVREAEVDCLLVAGRYTLLDQTADEELFQLCLERGVAVIAGGVLNSGILADPSPGATFDYRPAGPELVERAQRLRAVCERRGVPLLAAALQFPLRHPAVASLLVGARSSAELDESLDLLELELPPALWDELRATG